jgi:probable selenium-dependent hydroxylase accessory protein YqeC
MMINSLIDTLQPGSKGVISLIGAGGKTSLMFQLAKELSKFKQRVLTTTTTKIFMPKTWQSPETIIENDINKLIQKAEINSDNFYHFSAGSKYDPLSKKIKGFSKNYINQLWQTKIFDWIIVEADGAKQKPIKASDVHEPVIPAETTHLILVTGLDSVGKALNDDNVHRSKIFSRNTELDMGEIIDEQAVAASITIEIKKARLLSSPEFNIVFLNKADTQGRKISGQKITKLLKTDKSIDTIITASLHD